MKIVVTGGGGRLGRYVIKELVGHGHDVLSIDTVVPTEPACSSLAMDLGEVKSLFRVFEGAQAVVHLARIPFPYTANGYDPARGLWKTPDVATDTERFCHNVTITYNVLVVSLEAGVRRIVSASSLAVYGLYYPYCPNAPDYLPIDENHPLVPQDPYGMTKLVGEKLCDSFARKKEIQIASLRFAGIATDEQYRILLERQKDPLCRGTGALWSYIDVRDAAAACRLAVERDFSGHAAFNICAPKTMMKERTLDLVQRYLPQVRLIKSGLKDNWCGYDAGKAESILGFRAVHLLVD
ncbi:MAG TPA: NAD(P)-dependent oxidoreductase [Candidatus Binatia bacterium]|nr:NAD(P)-dependent oxidoreductase [Candidatus Binatia bacterium]